MHLGYDIFVDSLRIRISDTCLSIVSSVMSSESFRLRLRRRLGSRPHCVSSRSATQLVASREKTAPISRR